jgi:hypothetical protein
MKKFIFTSVILLIIVVIQAQGSRTDILQYAVSSQPGQQYQEVTATLKSSSRLFAVKEDITSVILIIPSGSVVNVTGYDSTYLKVKFEENEGWIFRRHANINTQPAKTATATQPQNFKQKEQTAEQKQVSRFTFLENKYGTDLANKMINGKIWRGMSAEMVKDSWGTPGKINRVIGEVVKEEWIYSSSWLYMEDNTLVQWGPVKK